MSKWMSKMVAKRYRYLNWLPFIVALCGILFCFSFVGIILSLIAAVGTSLLLQKLYALPEIKEALSLNHTTRRLVSDFNPDMVSQNRIVEDDRLVSWGEIAMGGPEYFTYLLRDGALIQDISSEWVDLAEGQYRIAMMDARKNQRWVIYSESDRCLYFFDAPELTKRYLQLVNSPKSMPLLLESLTLGTKVMLREFRGIWLLPELVPASIPEKLSYQLNSGAILEARLALPTNLRTLCSPERVLNSCCYVLYLDGNNTGKYVLDLDNVVESESGHVYAIESISLNRDMTVKDGQWSIFSSGQCRTLLGYAVHQGHHVSRQVFFIQITHIDDSGVATCYLRNWEPLQSDDNGSDSTNNVELTVDWQVNPIVATVEEKSIMLAFPVTG
ncbi:hypothetical protein I2494_16945 [Budviciaceae bacterium BWR-B9]|uniref:DUF58 domain-containing protein n=1 Tax=Limnobaculum allomyrinae TaxID=2791986 RepID=A0ABS1IUW3_9GAMM|nr:MULTISPECIES: hypothetical protein [Limnobaculum]MBK5145377.1 hypothetical protein [Limnobaculum allomyrinae]MBV7693195.1 hypothetical protein [Limnobaculum sp. M2-1]